MARGMEWTNASHPSLSFRPNQQAGMDTPTSSDYRFDCKSHGERRANDHCDGNGRRTADVKRAAFWIAYLSILAWIFCPSNAYSQANLPNNPNAATIQGPDPTGMQGYPLATVPATGALPWPVTGTFTGTVTGGPFLVGVESAGNSSDTLLGVSGVFTGQWEDISQYVSLEILVSSSANSATDGIILQWSHDGGVTIDKVDTFTLTSTVGGSPTRQYNYSAPIRGGAQYFRLIYTNGTSGLTVFHLHTWYRNAGPLQSFQVQQGTNNIWLPVNGNVSRTLLSLAARTTTQSNAIDINNNNWRGCIFILRVTAVPAVPGSGGLNFAIQSADNSGTKTTLNLPLSSNIQATGTYVWVLYPGAATTGASMNVRQVLSLPLPAIWNYQVTVGDAQSYTYSLTAQQQQ